MDKKNIEELYNIAQLKKKEEEERKKKLDDLNKKIQEEENNFKIKFNALKNKILIPFAKESNKALSSAGIIINYTSNEEAKEIGDQIKTFFKINYYPKYSEKYPFYLTFEGKKSLGLIEVTKKNSIGNDYTIKKVLEFSIDEFEESKIEECLMEFIRNVGKG